MDAISLLQDPQCLEHPARNSQSSRIVDAAHFRQLLVSHRRMVRADRRQEALRGLEDLDTGEVFLTDERRLLHPTRDLIRASN